MKNTSRQLMLVLSSALLVSACVTQPNPQQLKATVYLAKKIITMNKQQPVASAVAVSNGKIISVGSLESVRSALPKYQLVIDQGFSEKVIMPGLIDNHLHPALAGVLLPSHFITPFDWELPQQSVKGVQGREAYLTRLRELEASFENSEKMLITWGYHQYFHGDIRRIDLDKLSATRPILMWQRSFHELVMNTAALKALQITEEGLAHPEATNYENGHFWELGLFSIFPKLAPIILAPARFQQGMHDGLLHAQMNGVTTLADQGTPLFNLDMELASLNKVLSESKLPLRMLMVGNGKTLSTEGYKQGLEVINGLSSRNTELVQFLPNQVKLLADGAFYSQLMQMEDGYLDGHHGEWIMPPEELASAARVFWNAGYQLHIHVNGDKGVNVILQMIEQLQKETPRKDHRTVLHHYGYAAPEHAEKIAKAGISVSANPFYLWALGDKYSEIGLGPERAKYITRLGDLERYGVSVSFHSDLPMAPAAPLALAGVAASRITANGNLLAPSEKMSVDAALAGITLEAARAIQQQHRIGSIEVGKLADFTIIDQDPYSMEAQHLKDIDVWGTVLGGEVHPRPGG